MLPYMAYMDPMGYFGTNPHLDNLLITQPKVIKSGHSCCAAKKTCWFRSGPSFRWSFVLRLPKPPKPAWAPVLLQAVFSFSFKTLLCSNNSNMNMIKSAIMINILLCSNIVKVLSRCMIVPQWAPGTHGFLATFRDLLGAFCNKDMGMF